MSDNSTLSRSVAEQACVDRSRRDIGRAALFIALVSVLLVVIFFFAISQNLRGLAEEITLAGERAAQVEALSTELTAQRDGLAQLSGRMAALEENTRREFMAAQLAELSQRVAYLSMNMDTEEQTKELMQAWDLLNKVQAELAKK